MRGLTEKKRSLGVKLFCNICHKKSEKEKKKGKKLHLGNAIFGEQNTETKNSVRNAKVITKKKERLLK